MYFIFSKIDLIDMSQRMFARQWNCNYDGIQQVVNVMKRVCNKICIATPREHVVVLIDESYVGRFNGADEEEDYLIEQIGAVHEIRCLTS